MSYRMHYMVVRRMYLLDGWFVFSPEPYAGEPGEAVRLAERPDLCSGEEQGWQWLKLAYGDNSPAMAAEGSPPKAAESGPPRAAEGSPPRENFSEISRENFKEIFSEHTLVFPCYDFENSRETLGLCGITAGGEVVWGKRVQ